MGSLFTERINKEEKEKVFEECDCETIDLKCKDPMVIFNSWIEEAKRQSDLNALPETMTFCTIKEDGSPSARSLLLRGFDNEGFKMYWDKRSPKTQELNLDARGAIIFVWHIRDLDGSQGLRQARIEGTVEELSEQEVTEYFEGEPLMAKIRAVVCHQSKVVKDDRSKIRKEINKLWKEVNDKGLELQKPAYFAGYILKPNMIEFYKGKKNSINDRIRFTKSNNNINLKDERDGVFVGENGWTYEQLEP